MRRTMTVLEWALSAVSLAIALVITVSALFIGAIWRVAPFVGIAAMLWWLWN